MKDLNVLVQDCEDILNDLGIEYGPIKSVTINNRLTACWGRCKRKRSENTYSIEFSNRIMQDDTEYEATMNTVIHEFLHAHKDRMCHTGEWKRCANLVNANFPQFNIQRCTSAEEKGVAKREVYYRYIVKCTDCDRTWKYQKSGKVVRALKRSANSCTCVCGSRRLVLIER